MPYVLSDMWLIVDYGIAFSSWLKQPMLKKRGGAWIYNSSHLAEEGTKQAVLHVWTVKMDQYVDKD